MARCRELGMSCGKVATIWGYKTDSSVRQRTDHAYYLLKLKESQKRKRPGTSSVYAVPIIVDGNEDLIREIRNTSCCAACGIHENKMTHLARKDRLCLDHCHKTGQPRALLCGKCNMAEGLFEENPEDLLKLYAYVTSRT